MDGLVEKVARAIHGQLGGGTGGYDDAARAAIEAVFDALAERAQESIDAAFEQETTGATTGRTIMMANGARRARVEAWTVMLATLRKQALG